MLPGIWPEDSRSCRRRKISYSYRFDVIGISLPPHCKWWRKNKGTQLFFATSCHMSPSISLGSLKTRKCCGNAVAGHTLLLTSMALCPSMDPSFRLQQGLQQRFKDFTSWTSEVCEAFVSRRRPTGCSGHQICKERDFAADGWRFEELLAYLLDGLHEDLNLVKVERKETISFIFWLL